jgi:acetyl-CoA carboxylase biotin carboxyl carrier protein
MAVQAMPMAQARAGCRDLAAAASGARTAAADPSKHPGAVKSPMVGTAYLAPEPGAPFIDVAPASPRGRRC